MAGSPWGFHTASASAFIGAVGMAVAILELSSAPCSGAPLNRHAEDGRELGTTAGDGAHRVAECSLIGATLVSALLVSAWCFANSGLSLLADAPRPLQPLVAEGLVSGFVTFCLTFGGKRPLALILAMQAQATSCAVAAFLTPRSPRKDESSPPIPGVRHAMRRCVSQTLPRGWRFHRSTGGFEHKRTGRIQFDVPTCAGVTPFEEMPRCDEEQGLLHSSENEAGSSAGSPMGSPPARGAAGAGCPSPPAMALEGMGEPSPMRRSASAGDCLRPRGAHDGHARKPSWSTDAGPVLSELMELRRQLEQADAEPRTWPDSGPGADLAYMDLEPELAKIEAQRAR